MRAPEAPASLIAAQLVPAPLIAVAHGSRDPRSAQVMAAVVADVRAAHPGLDVRLAFLDLSLPGVEEVLSAVAADGHHEAVVVPLLLGDAFHSRVDLPGLLSAASQRHPGLALTQADVLGSGLELLSALHSRLREAGARADDGELGVVLTAVGSSRTQSNEAVQALARRLEAGSDWAGVEVAFATAGADAVANAVSSLRERGASRTVIAPWFLAPGLLLDRVYAHALAADPDALLAQPLGVCPGLRQVIVDRYLAAATQHVEAAA